VTRVIRLLLVTKSTGGVASYVRALVNGLDRNKFAITVACLSENGELFSSELRRDFEVQAFSLAMNRYKVDLVTDAKVWFELARHIRRHQYDLIHAHASKPGFLTRLAAIGTSVPVLYSPHNFAFHEGSNAMAAFLVAVLESLAARFTTRIIAVANHERDLALKYRVGKPQLYEIIHTGINAQPFFTKVNKSEIRSQLGIPVNSYVIGVVGRMAHPKLPSDFVRFASKFLSEMPTARFVWIGSGPLEFEAKELSRNLGLDGVIYWLGERSDVPSILQSFDCFVLPSKWEGFPLVVLEAFAARVPVVATINLGSSELIESARNGWLVPVGDTDALVNCVLNVSTNVDGTAQAVNNAERDVRERYSYDRMISRITTVYERDAR